MTKVQWHFLGETKFTLDLFLKKPSLISPSDITIFSKIQKTRFCRRGVTGLFCFRHFRLVRIAKRSSDTSVIDIPDSCFHNLVLAGIMSVSVQFHPCAKSQALTPFFFTISTFTKLYSNWIISKANLFQKILNNPIYSVLSYWPICFENFLFNQFQSLYSYVLSRAYVFSNKWMQKKNSNRR